MAGWPGFEGPCQCTGLKSNLEPETEESRVPPGLLLQLRSPVLIDCSEMGGKGGLRDGRRSSAASRVGTPVCRCQMLLLLPRRRQTVST